MLLYRASYNFVNVNCDIVTALGFEVNKNIDKLFILLYNLTTG